MALSKIVENSITDGVVSSAKLKDFSAAVDLNGVELILDDDQDTSITADTDDRIDFKIANTDHISIGTSSGDTVIKAMTDAKDIIFQQFDGKKLLEINDGGFVAIANGASSGGVLRIYEDTDLGTNYVGLSVGNVSTAYTLALPNADGSSGQALTTDGSGVLSFSTISTALDDLTAGDAALNITTTAGNITIDAQGNDTDIIFKGTDGGADKTFMTIDGSAGGDLFLTGGLIDLKNDGSAVSQIKFYCESSNAHAQTLIGAPHSESATNTLTLPSTGGNSYLLTAASTATLTNKTLTSPKINENVALTATATELNLLDGVSGLVQADLTKLAAIDATATELNLIDGGATVGTTAFADGDGILHNDGGTMRVTSATTLKTYMSDLTLTTAAQGNVTSLGTLTALTVDDVAIDGKVMTMTGSSSDTFVVTVGTNGATSLVTTDAAAAAANLQITADGTVDIDSAGVLTLDSGAAINIEPASGSAILLDGTISVDAGVVTGATSITSTAFVGALTGAASSNLLKAGGTMTGDLILGDNVKLEIGSASGGDLQLYHDASHSYISDQGTGNLRVLASNFEVKNAANDEDMIGALADGSVKLYHNNVKKLETDANGVTITGTVATLISPNDGQGEIAFGDADDANIGRFAYNHASNFLATVVNTTEYMRIHSNGVTSIPQGIALGVAVSANTASNVLDDYEEGTYAVVVTGATSGSFTMSTENVLAYTKVGRIISIQGTIGVQSGSVSGNVRMSLPFAPTELADDAEIGRPSLFLSNTGNTNAGQTFLQLSPDGSAYFTKVADDGTFSTITNSDVDGTFEVGVSFTYISG